MKENSANKDQPVASDYAVFGRIPEGDDCVAVFTATSKEDAERQFTDWLYEHDGESERERVFKAHGVEAFIEGVVRGTNLEVL